MTDIRLFSVRIRNLIDDIPGIIEKQIFGGTALLLNGNMGCGIHKDHLLARVGKENYRESLKKEVCPKI